MGKLCQKNIALILICIVMLSGCATTAKLEEKMQARLGQNVNDVINEIGPPTKTNTKPGGDIIYSWVVQGSSRATAYQSFGMTHLRSTAHSCQLSFTAGKDGIIKSWVHQGNMCRSR